MQNPPQLRPHRASQILVLGILSLVLCMPLGILAWVFAKDDLKAMDAGTMDPSGRSNTEAGKICGMISTVLTIIIFSLAGLVMGLGFIANLLSPHH